MLFVVPRMSNPPLSSSDLTTILESDLWGLQEFNQELQDIDELVKQCDAIKSRIQKIESTVGMRLSSSMLFVLYQKHREKSLKKQILSAIERTIPKIIYVEESIRLWLEAIVMKKWSMRHEAFQHFHHMDLVIKMYKKYLNDNIERLNECNEVLLGIKEFIRQRKHELDFIDVGSISSTYLRAINVGFSSVEGI